MGRAHSAHPAQIHDRNEKEMAILLLILTSRSISFNIFDAGSLGRVCGKTKATANSARRAVLQRSAMFFSSMLLRIQSVVLAYLYNDASFLSQHVVKNSSRNRPCVGLGEARTIMDACGSGKRRRLEKQRMADNNRRR